MAARWSDNIGLKVVNVLVFLFLFGSNTYASVRFQRVELKRLLIFRAQVDGAGAGKLTHISPASYVYYIWTIINALLGGMVRS
jgi:hypothetical protein